MPAVAVNVTLVLAHIDVLVAEIDTDGVEFALTVISREFEVTTNGEAQFAFDVICRLITSLFARAELLYVVELRPTLTPFFSH